MSGVAVEIIAATLGELRQELKRIKKAKIDKIICIIDPIARETRQVYGPFAYMCIRDGIDDKAGERTVEIIKKLAGKKKKYPDDMSINKFMRDVEDIFWGSNENKRKY